MLRIVLDVVALCQYLGTAGMEACFAQLPQSYQVYAVRGAALLEHLCRLGYFILSSLERGANSIAQTYQVTCTLFCCLSLVCTLFCCLLLVCLQHSSCLLGAGCSKPDFVMICVGIVSEIILIVIVACCTHCTCPLPASEKRWMRTSHSTHQAEIVFPAVVLKV